MLPISLYEQLVEQAEELQDIRDFDKAVKDPVFAPWERGGSNLIYEVDPPSMNSHKIHDPRDARNSVIATDGAFVCS